MVCFLLLPAGWILLVDFLLVPVSVSNCLEVLSGEPMSYLLDILGNTGGDLGLLLGISGSPLIVDCSSSC